MLLHSYRQMTKVYRLDCKQGIFGVKPDGNFRRLLRFSSKILVNISKKDRYYPGLAGFSLCFSDGAIF